MGGRKDGIMSSEAEVMHLSTECREQLNDLLDELPEENLRALFEALRRAGSEGRIRRWSRAVGSVSDRDAEEMRRAVEEACEEIDADGW